MSTQKPLLLLISIVVALSLAACGGESDSDGGGGDSPQDVVNQMAAAIDGDDMSAVIPLVLPEHRGMMTFMVGMMGPTLAIGFSTMGTGGDEAVAAKGKEMSDEWDALLKKYKIEMPDNKEDGGAGGMMGGGDPKEAFARFDKLLGHVDHQAFVKESMAFTEKHSDKSKSTSKRGMSKFDPADVTIVQDGDSATVTRKDKPKPMTLVRKNGRWYIDMTSM